MEPQRFDTLVTALGRGASRRHLLRRLLAGAMAGAALGSGTVAWDGSRRGAAAAPKPCSIGCAGLSGPQKAASKQACRACGGDFDRVCIEEGPFGPTNFVCCPEGSVCDFEGSCIEVTICPSGEPADNCTADVFTDCGLVDDVDDGCTCIQRSCGAPCTSSADCAGAACVSVPGCCPDDTFCAVPCDATAAARRRRRAASGRWRRGR